MTKLRLSYTLVRNWKEGRRDDCVKNYLHMDTFVSDRMRLGSEFDLKVEESLKVLSAFPPELGNIKWENPKPKLQITVDWPEDKRFTVKGEFDAYSEPAIIEIKCSATRDSAEISNDDQLSFYFLLADIAGIKADYAKLFRYDPSTRKFDMSLVWKSVRRMEEARAMINKYGPEIYEYFTQEGIL